jgi:alpha-L-rhamnosidase
VPTVPDDPSVRPRSGLVSRRQVLKGGVIGTAAAVSIRPSKLRGDSVGQKTTKSRTASHDAHLQVDDTAGAPTSLTVDGLVSPIGLSPDDIHFAWHINDGRRGARQGAYRVMVVQPSIAGPQRGQSVVVWDSGQVRGQTQSFVPYGGPKLASDTAYQWTVQTWAGKGAPGPLAASGSFETGLEDSDWKALWVSRPADVKVEPDQYTYVRTSFDLRPSPVVRARAYVAGDQQYELSVNGVRAAKGQAYSYPDSQYYETTDITALLVAGSGNGVGLLYNWQGATKGHPAGTPGVIAQISVLHEDGTSELIVTDGSWTVLSGAWLPGTQRDLEGDLVDFTENIDGPRIPTGWDTASFDAGGWDPATVLGPAGSHPWTHLVSVRTRISHTPVSAVALTTLPSGAVVADFGKVYAAVPTVMFHNGVANRVISMRAGYLLDRTSGPSFVGEPGQVSIEHGTQHTNMGYSYVQRGGVEQFLPFDYLGFRYFQVDNPGEVLSADDFVALTRHTVVPDENAATFSCSDPTIDAIFELGRHSALFTAQEQFVDTPTREKGPWLWDGFNESQTAMVAFGEQNLSRKSLMEFADSQARYWRNGAVNKIYPTGLGAGDINEYTEIYPEWVWQYWLNTGDTALLEAVFGVLTGVSDYVNHSIDHSTGLIRRLPSTEYTAYGFPVVTRINVLGANVFHRVADIAAILKRPRSEVARQRGRHQALTQAINSSLTRSDGIYVDGIESDGSKTTTASQDANSCALAYGVVPQQYRSAVAGHIASLGLDVDPQSATDVLKSLAANGREADLLRILTDATIKGWANVLARGGTFTWEVWEPSDRNGDSMSHGWGSNVLVEIQRQLLGVRPTGPGFATFEVAPPRHVLEWATGTVPTTRGPVVVSWERAASPKPTLSLGVTVPANATATILLPVPPSATITESGIPVKKAAGVTSVKVGTAHTVVNVGAGSYQFAVLKGART